MYTQKKMYARWSLTEVKWVLTFQESAVLYKSSTMPLPSRCVLTKESFQMRELLCEVFISREVKLLPF